MDTDLAIIVPAYKAEYLAQSLRSVMQQTDQSFALYVFDDASPSELGGLVDSVLGSRPRVFHRFQSNMGGQSLVQHWERCIALTREPWIWLFSDDDVMEPNCVAHFHDARRAAENAGSVYRYDALLIDERDATIGLHSRHPEEESWLEFAYARLCGWRPSIMQQIVFPRKALEDAGGLVDLPLAWCSDDAAIIAMARHRKIRRIGGARIFWRQSPHNISPADSVAIGRLKLRAVSLFLRWLLEQLQTPREELFPDDSKAFAEAMQKYLRRAISDEGPLAAIANWRLLASTAEEVCQTSKLSVSRDIALASLSRIVWRLSAYVKSLFGARALFA